MFFLKRKSKKDKEMQKRIEKAVETEMEGYITREDLDSYLKKIKNDTERIRLWNSLSIKKKLAVLRKVKKNGR